MKNEVMELNELNEIDELNEEELDLANGGMIVDRGYWYDWYVVDDYSGFIQATTFYKGEALDLCETYTTSKRIISEAQYNAWMEGRRRGDPSSPFTPRK